MASKLLARCAQERSNTWVGLRLQTVKPARSTAEHDGGFLEQVSHAGLRNL
jgi:hypothetical protein